MVPVSKIIKFLSAQHIPIFLIKSINIKKCEVLKLRGCFLFGLFKFHA